MRRKSEGCEGFCSREVEMIANFVDVQGEEVSNDERVSDFRRHLKESTTEEVEFRFTLFEN